jgi:hypothetical protein
MLLRRRLLRWRAAKGARRRGRFPRGVNNALLSLSYPWIAAVAGREGLWIEKRRTARTRRRWLTTPCDLRRFDHVKL